jgi:hypothetical protein
MTAIINQKRDNQTKFPNKRENLFKINELGVKTL